MTVDTTIRKKIYLGNANQKEFAIPFVYIKDSDIRAVRTKADGTDVQILDNYSIAHQAGGWAVFTYPLTGAPLEFGESLTIYRVTDTRQLTDLLNGGDFNADVIELALDQITMMVQDLAEEMGRVPVIPISESADFDEMIQNILIAEANIEADRKFIEEMAGTFESATETQRGVVYIATEEEAETYTSEAREPAGSAVLTPEIGEKLARSIVAEYGLDSAAIDRLGTVRIAKQSEVTNGLTETGRSPAVIRPEEHAAAHKAIIKLYTESGSYVPTKDCLIKATIVDGGSGGQGGGRVNAQGGGAISGSGGRGAMHTVAWFFVKKDVPIYISVGAGGSGGAGRNNSSSGYAGVAGGKSSVGFAQGIPIYLTIDGQLGNYSQNPYVGAPGQIAPTESSRGAGAEGIRYHRGSDIISSAPGAGGGASTDLGGYGGAGGTAGVMPYILLTLSVDIPVAGSGGAATRGSRGGSGGSGFGAGGGGGGAVTAQSSDYWGGSGGAGAPGCVVLEIFLGGKSDESDV